MLEDIDRYRICVNLNFFRVGYGWQTRTVKSADFNTPEEAEKLWSKVYKYLLKEQQKLPLFIGEPLANRDGNSITYINQGE